jgi:predicted PurR-regulated permease PerM
MVKNQQRIEQIAGLVLIGAIVIGCWFVLRPFVLSILWAAILCFATWPVYERLLKLLRGRRTLTASIMTVVLLLVLFIPFFIVSLTFTDSIRSAVDWLNTHRQAGLPPMPDWLKNLPLVGAAIDMHWNRLATNAVPVMERLKPFLQDIGLWLLKHSIDFARGVLQLAMSVLIAFFLYRDGQRIIARLQESFQRMSGDYSQRLIEVAKATVQSVVYGVLGAALAQGIMAGIGFTIVGASSPMLLALFTFCLSFIPAGPVIIWLSVSIWLFSDGRIGWGIFMIIYGVLAISSIDNLVRPYIISRGSRLPFIVMFIGVVGGIVTFGFIGVFLGPTLLTVGYSLLQEIISNRRHIHSQKSADKSQKASPLQDKETSG